LLGVTIKAEAGLYRVVVNLSAKLGHFGTKVNHLAKSSSTNNLFVTFNQPF
jgi:hypothetical protein